MYKQKQENNQIIKEFRVHKFHIHVLVYFRIWTMIIRHIISNLKAI